MTSSFSLSHRTVVCAVAVAFSAPLFAADWYVAENGDDIDNAGGPSDPFAALAAAVEAAHDLDVIHVANGTYQPSGPVLVDKAVEIAGNDGDRSKVVFDGQGKYKLVSVSNAGAFIHGLTFLNGKGNNTAIQSVGNYFHGCSFEMSAGTVSNCVIRSGKANYTGSLSVWGTAKVFDCVIADGENTDGNGAAAGIGGSLKMSGSSLVSGCTITGGKAVNGGGVYVSGANARLVGCTVSNNTEKATNGGGVYVNGGGVVSNCVVTANKADDKGGGIYVDSGKVYNTLVFGNSGRNGGGVCLAGGSARLFNCTVVDNAAQALGANLNRTAAAQTVNTIVAGGVHSTAGSDTASYFGDEPGFRDAAHGDYRLTAASPCIDAGTAQNWGAGATDVSGATARVIDGDVDGTAAVDIGAFEYDPVGMPAGCVFRVSAPAVAAFPMDVSFIPAIEGPCGDVTAVTWSFGDGGAATSASLADAPHAYAAPGAYTVTLTVETTLGGMLTTTEAVVLKGATAYVSTTGSATPPYATPATAAASLADAIAYLGTPASGKAKVVVLGGTYLPTSTTIVTREIEIAGNDADPSQVIFDGRGKYKLLSISAEAFVHGITFENGKGDGSAILSGAPSYSQGCSFEMNAGTVSNCVIRSGTANYTGSLSMWGTAQAVDCVIADGTNNDTNPANAARGGSLKMAGNAVARRCSIVGGRAYMGAGATVEDNALLVDSTVSGAKVSGATATTGGAGIHVRGSGVVSNCVVTACTNLVASTNAGYGGGGIHMAGGTVVNTLVHGNSGNVGGGICQNGGKVVNCTVAGNTATVSASGVSQFSGQIVNTVIAGNAMNDTAAYVGSGGTITHSCALGLADGVSGNAAVDPMAYFRDPQNGDYSMLGSFPGIDAGDASVAFAADATDVSGTVRRILDGKGDGTAIVDMGAYEYDFSSVPSSLQLSHSVVAYEAFTPTVVRLTPALEGPCGEVTSVSWNFGDGSTESAQAVDVNDHSYVGAGTYTATLTVETTLGGTLRQSATFTLAPLVVYVSESGTAEAPYDTAAKATSSLADAMAALGTQLSGSAYVILADGTYDAPASRIGITHDTEIRGNDADPSRVVIDGHWNGSTGNAFFFVNASGSLIHGVTFRHGNTTSGQTPGAPAYSCAALEIAAGTVSNCVIDSCTCAYAGGVSLWGTGRLLDSLVANCTNRDSNGDIAAKGAGVKMYQNAYVSGCTFTNNATRRGGGAALFGGTLENCTFYANRTTDAGYDGAGMHMEGGTARNVLVRGNRSAGKGGGVGIQGSGAILESATVVDNVAKSGGGLDVHMTAGTLRNAIVSDALAPYDAENPPLVVTGGTVAYSCSPSLAAGVEGNIADAPAFKAPGKGDYRPRNGSQAIDGGQNQDWMEDAKDLAGARRVTGARVDMGCYERTFHETVIKLR